MKYIKRWCMYNARVSFGRFFVCVFIQANDEW